MIVAYDKLYRRKPSVDEAPQKRSVDSTLLSTSHFNGQNLSKSILVRPYGR
jgi:hypothetical protein